MKKVITLFVLIFIITGCGINLPFNNRLSYKHIREAKNITKSNKGPISIKWIPANFPERIDIQGASGAVGSASNTRIPIGVALSSRITEVLDTSIGINESSRKTVIIKIDDARTEFEYCSIVIGVPSIDLGRCFLDIEFISGDKRWRKKFKSEAYDPTYGCTSQTGILEKAWDDIALQVGREIVDNL